MAGRLDKVTTFKLFVKNLGYGTTQEELKSVFETCGRVVECQIFKNTLAFVHMENEISGRNAILMLNSKLINGKCVAVEESLHKEGPSVASTRLRVRNVPTTLSANALRDLFSKYGAILAVEIKDDEAIVTIEAVADMRSAINDLNGYAWDGQQITVEPILNTAISYSPKKKMPWYDAYPQKYSGPPRNDMRNGPPRPMFLGRGFNPPASRGANFHNPEGRVLRDPIGAGFPPPPPIAYGLDPPSRPHIPTVMGRDNNHYSNVTIEPLFFKRHELNNKQQQQPNQVVSSSLSFDEDVSINNFDNSGVSFESPQKSNSVPSSNPSDKLQQQLAGHQRQRIPMKRHAVESFTPEAGEQFPVPGMIAPGTFKPPKKYYCNLPNRPKKKKNKSQIKPQLPIPEDIYFQRPVPDFSSYYTEPSTPVSLRPFPPPSNPEYDYTDDIDV